MLIRVNCYLDMLAFLFGYINQLELLFCLHSPYLFGGDSCGGEMKACIARGKSLDLPNILLSSA